jgi:two-component system sensor histidine kinase NreB
VNAFNARTRISVEYNRNGLGNPPSKIKEMIYRVTQEALNNISKHADATNVAVQLDSQPNNVRLTIQDNGIGFELKSAKMEGMGLTIMAERALNVDAKLEIHSQIHEGTRLQIIWPVLKDQE